jgi:vanZ family protein
MKLSSVSAFLKIWGPTLILMLIIFTLSNFEASVSDLQSGFIINALRSIFPDLTNSSLLVVIVRKLAHFSEYALLGFFTARALKLSFSETKSSAPNTKSSSCGTKKYVAFSILFCALYACTDEFHQIFISGRSGELKDVALDTVGATFGVLIYYIFVKFMAKTHDPSSQKPNSPSPS